MPFDNEHSLTALQISKEKTSIVHKVTTYQPQRQQRTAYKAPEVQQVQHWWAKQGFEDGMGG